MNSDLDLMAEAIAEAKKGLAVGGIPIGSVLVVNDKIIVRAARLPARKPVVRRWPDRFRLSPRGAW